MRFVSRILIGAGAVTALAVAAPTAASAATVSAPATAAASASASGWGSYYSADKKSKANGTVSVQKKSHKVWYKKKYYKLVKKCWTHKGKKYCKWVKVPAYKKAYKWVHTYYFDVNSRLYNFKTWGDPRYRCAWETFKVVKKSGGSYYKSYNNCKKWPAKFSLEGKDAKQILVQVSRGNSHSPKGKFGGWHSIYSAA